MEQPSFAGQLLPGRTAQALLPDFTMQRRIWPLLLGLGYIALIYALGGLRPEHVIIGSLGLLDAYNPSTRRFLKEFFPFVLTGIVFDSMRYYYWWGISHTHVRVDEVYYRDLYWFGINTVVDGVGRRLTPNEYFDIHQWRWVDLLTGFAYLVFIFQYLSVAVMLFILKEAKWNARFGWGFFVVNLVGFITYYLYPAAPPWYVTRYGLGPANMDATPSSASAVRFDQHLGTHFFSEMYGRGIDVFGAYPSLHVAYPLLATYMLLKVPRLRWLTLPGLAFYALMCFSAVYLQHHYVMDIVLGTAYALAAIAVIEFLSRHRRA